VSASEPTTALDVAGDVRHLSAEPPRTRASGSTASDTPVLLEPIEEPRWREFVEGADGASVFHHPRWLSLLREQYGYQLSACCLADSEGTVRGGLPLARISSRLTGERLVALPFSDVCPLLCSAERKHALAAALEALQRSEGVTLHVHGSLPGVGRPGASYHHHLVPLQRDVEAVQRGFTRRQALQGVRRAQREGVAIERRTDSEALGAFYRLHNATRRRQGMPTQPRRFIGRFAGLFEHDLGFVSLAQLEGRTIAAAVFLVFNGVLTYKYGASDVRFLDRRPNNLLFMDTIRWGCQEGLHTFDMGRTDIGQESLRAFKLMWGAEERLLHYTEIGDASAERRSSDPPAALRTLIARAPRIVSRSVGELFYRHAG
jgi:CelD/BcsL family acetyltransferase involved in cellulose biosynthesis